MNERLQACCFARRVLPIYEERQRGRNLTPDINPRQMLREAEKFSLGLPNLFLEFIAYLSIDTGGDADSVRVARAVQCATFPHKPLEATKETIRLRWPNIYLHTNTTYTPFFAATGKVGENSTGLVRAWVHQWVEQDRDNKGLREILADSLMEDGVVEELCDQVRRLDNWYPGMWPMTISIFKGENDV